MDIYCEIREHLGIAEGTQLLADKKEIEKTVSMRGFVATNIQTSFDTMQDIFRWTCDINPPAE